MKQIVTLILVSLLTSQLYSIKINNGIPSGTKGYYAIDIAEGGRSRNGWIGTGPFSHGDVEFIFDYYPYYSIGDGSANVFTGSPLDLGSNQVQNTGKITGENAPLDFTVLSYILPGEMRMIQTWTFTSQKPFGKFRFIQYLDEDVFEVSDDVLVPLGKYADGTLQLYTIDDSSLIGTFQTVDPNDEQNVTWVGWSADVYPVLKAAIYDDTIIFLPDGFIETNSLPPIAGTSPQEYGTNDVTSAVAYDLDPTATQAVLTVVLGGTYEARLAAHAIKIFKLKMKDKGEGKSGFSAKMGYNWSGQLPITSVSVVLGDYTNENIAVTAKGKGFVSAKNPNLKLKVIPKKHTVIVKLKKVNPISLGLIPSIQLGLDGTGDPFVESRDVILILFKGKYVENKFLFVPLLYVDKAKIKDSGKAGKDKLKLKATLNGDAVGAGTGLTVKIEGESGPIFEQTIPSADFTGKNGAFKYKRAKGAGTPIKSVKISAWKKNITILADNFDIPAGAIGTATDPLITIGITADFTTLSGGGSLLIRFNQKKPGNLKF